ncbi:LuxR C-terminal-related transcriptional regulator [Sinorhizobium prairiense]|uniref:LuxR C-terminal-related transcriptional regulator n=1 Tax=unclassified Sinorhizobium TaxID=2613772 RepID=UPI0023D8558F|nr:MULTISPECIES: response regulator transcription factor [unclassified Sinorhizobium]WEJ09952.1 response regulator transcription factor [Sinorhizobium sp. M103]WEJ15496.1 response regulator transcription factor [Sinorhizobium sp. K101]WEJ36915.1 response regulator transcription factor [Sinorhizobium sp. C101]
MRVVMQADKVDVILVDMTQPLDLEEVRSLAASNRNVVLVALGLNEHRQDVIRCGRAGFTGYVSRDSTVEQLVKAINDTIAGRLACPEEISGGLLRALFTREPEITRAEEGQPLTKREGDVLQLIGRGMTNKEIARELGLSVATVKHHVHNVLEKLSLPRRAHAMRRVRERPWLAS